MNGIRAVWNKGKFQDFINQHDPDILCLQEIKATADQSPIDLPNYEKLYCSAVRPGYAGTAILTKIKPIAVSHNFSAEIAKKYNFEDKYGDTNQEGRLLTIEFPDFYVVTVYTPNSKGDLGRLTHRQRVWDPAFRDHCQQLASNKPVLASGDFNVAHNEIDLARPKENTGKHGFTNEERQGFDKLLETGFSDTFRTLHTDVAEAYSWWTAWGQARARNVGWRIDYWLISNDLKPNLKSARIHADILGSDHCPVSIEMKL